MDVAKYIGLFLLKNEQCYVSGLGTLQLLRKAATYDGHSLQPASYEIALAQGGNVDESLANYIANNEQTSISKASNALNDYSTDARNKLQAGEEVTLPYLGKFVMLDNRINFITAPQLLYTAPPIPVQKGISLQHNDRVATQSQRFVLPTAPITNPIPTAETIGTVAAPAMPQVKKYMQQQAQPTRLNWARIIFVLLLLIILAGLTYYGYHRYMVPKRQTNQQPALTPPESVLEDVPLNTDVGDTNSIFTDSLNNTDSSLAEIPVTAIPEPTLNEAGTSTIAPPVPAQKTRNLRIALHSSDSWEGANKIKNSINSRGNKIEIIKEESNYYYIVVHIKTANPNNDQVEDSVSKLYNISAAYVYLP